MRDRVRCPECNNPQLCSCKHCGNNRKVSEDWIGGELIACSSCGFTQHADGWLDTEWKQFMNRCPICKKSKAKTEIICSQCNHALNLRKVRKHMIHAYSKEVEDHD